MARLIEHNPFVLVSADHQAPPDAHLADMFTTAARAYIHDHAMDAADEALLLNALGLNDQEVMS